MNCCGVASSAAIVAKADTQADMHDRLREADIHAASRSLGNGVLQTAFVVPDMHCSACIRTLEKGLSQLSHVSKARVNLSMKRVFLDWNPELGSGTSLQDGITGLGFSNSLFVTEGEASEAIDKKGRSLLTALAVAGFAAANIMLLSVSVWSGATEETAKLFHLISGIIAVPTVAIAGRPFFSSAFNALKAARLNMDVPISLAVLLALGMGIFETFGDGQEAYFDACVMLLFFLLIGRYLDHLMRERARGSVESLGRLNARGGLLITDKGDTEYIALSQIKAGMRLRVLPGERMPVDGKVLWGASEVDRSLVTGESEPVGAFVDTYLEAGTLNLTGPLDVEAQGDASSSFLSEMMRMMEAAENGRGHYVRLAERMASVYAPAVHLLALITFIGWMMAGGGQWQSSIYTAIAVLIITCPCALGLAVPVVHVVAASRLMERGIMMRDGGALERLSETSRIVFDKTGTLTRGEPELQNNPEISYPIRAVIGELASLSNHPFARVLAGTFPNSKQCLLEKPVEHAGYGIEARWKTRTVRLGRPEWVMEIAGESQANRSCATTLFAVEERAPIPFIIKDRLRSEAANTVSLLRSFGLDCEILSGDRGKSVRTVASKLGGLESRWQLTPADKVQRLQELEKAGFQVLMVGDGLNDGPALAAAHVSMTPASASEVGRSAADFVFTRNHLSAVAFSIAIARESTKIIKQNFAIAIAYNCVAVPFAMAGFVTPLIAAIAMSASSIVVVANSLRLSRMTLTDGKQEQALYPSNRRAVAT